MPARLGRLLFIAVLIVPSAATAQLHRATDPVMLPARSLVSQDDALVLDLHPGSLSLLPGWSVAYLHAEADERDSWLGSGDALYFAAPLWFGFAGGLSVQSIRPGDLAARPPGSASADRAMVALALGFSRSESFGIGLTTRTFSSGNPYLDGLTAVDLGMTFRPGPRLSLSLTGRDLFVSREGQGTGGLDLASSLLVGTSFRPFGNPEVVLDFALSVDSDDPADLGGRAGVTLPVPYVGSLSGVLETQELGEGDSDLRFMAELSVQLGGASLAGGVSGGDAFDGDAGWYALARAEAEPRRGVPPPGRILEIELRGLSPRGLVGVVAALEQARVDERIRGVLLRPRSSGMGLAYAQELRLLISELRAAGKPVACHLDSVSGAEYYACAGADQILVDPAGDVRLMGLSSTSLLFGETLRKIGVHADFVRIGDYKSAPEQYTQGHLSEAAREQARALLDDAHQRMLADLAGDLESNRAAVAGIIDRGPYLADAAIDAGLVEAAVDERTLDDASLPLFAGRPRVDRMPPSGKRQWGKAPAIGILMIDDNIVDGDSVDIPFIDMHMSGARTVIDALEGMVADPRIRAIVVRVDSPGGAVLASDQIWRAIRRAREHKPVIASMGQVAASGGYYVACAADEIWADPSTVTGSIGIFYGKVDVAELANKVGVGIEHFSRGAHAGANSMWRPFTPEERASLTGLLRSYYRTFLERVAESRGMDVEQVDAIARGRVWSGDAAVANGLVDRLGGLASALARARQRAGLGRDVELVMLPRRKTSLVDFVLGGVSVEAAGTAAPQTEEPVGSVELPSGLAPLVRSVGALHVMGSGRPMALMPYQVVF